MKTGCNPLQSDCVYRQQFIMLSWAHVWTSFIQSCFYKVLNLATALLVKDRALWVFLFHSKSWFCHLLLVNLFTSGVFGVFLSIPPLLQSINIPSSCCFRLSVCQKELANYYTVFHLCFTQHPNCFLVWVVLCGLLLCNKPRFCCLRDRHISVENRLLLFESSSKKCIKRNLTQL